MKMQKNAANLESLKIHPVHYQELLELHNLYSSPEELRQDLWQFLIDATNTNPIEQEERMERVSDQIFTMHKVSEILTTLFQVIAENEYEEARPIQLPEAS